jgi:hypothetical protein
MYLDILRCSYTSLDKNRARLQAAEAIRGAELYATRTFTTSYKRFHRSAESVHWATESNRVAGLHRKRTPSTFGITRAFDQTGGLGRCPKEWKD